jgi:hypothetical protein
MPGGARKIREASTPSSPAPECPAGALIRLTYHPIPEVALRSSDTSLNSSRARDPASLQAKSFPRRNARVHRRRPFEIRLQSVRLAMLWTHGINFSICTRHRSVTRGTRAPSDVYSATVERNHKVRIVRLRDAEPAEDAQGTFAGRLPPTVPVRSRRL